MGHRHPSSPGALGATSTVLAAALGAALTHVALLGWDREYDRDPVTGNLSGPYEAWQVLGCVAALTLMAYAGGRAGRPWQTSLALTAAFTVAWSIGAATMQTTGANLWVVGAVLLAGAVLGGTVLAALAAQRRSPRSR